MLFDPRHRQRDWAFLLFAMALGAIGATFVLAVRAVLTY